VSNYRLPEKNTYPHTFSAMGGWEIISIEMRGMKGKEGVEKMEKRCEG